MCYGNIPELTEGLERYFLFYNAERRHQSLGYRVPNEVYLTGEGGGACIVDKFSESTTIVGVKIRTTL